MAQSLAPLRLGFGGDEIGEAFDFGQVELAVFKGSAGEFAGFGRPRFRETRERPDQGRDYRRPAMDMELGAILAGKAHRPGEEKRKAPVDGHAVQILERRQGRASGFGLFLGERGRLCCAFLVAG